MTQIYFITEKQLREATLINDNTEATYLNKAIIDAQDVDLQQVIGSKLYKSLKEQVIAGEMKSEFYRTLMDEYIPQYLINQVMATITIPLHYKFRNSGIVTNADQHYNTASLNEVTYVEKHYKNLATFAANRMVEFILNNREEFPEIEECDTWLKLSKSNTQCPIHFRK